MRRIVNLFLLVLGIIVLLFLGFLTYASFTDYRPKEYKQITEYPLAQTLPDSVTYSVAIWNIGYAGLGANMDFFYDGGEKVRDTEDNVRRNMFMISKQLIDMDTMDFLMLQEVDISSKRSYFINQLQWIDKKLPAYFPYFGVNYKVNFVPVPLKAPMGKVESGLVTFSKPLAKYAYRFSFPGNYSWPTRLFMLDRCFLVKRYPVSNGKEFILINTHNSAYDDGTLRKKQMDYLKSFLLKEYHQGNYVLVGGDWNQCPPEFEPGFAGQLFDTINMSFIEKNYPETGWQWVYDKATPTNRRVKTPYSKEESLTTVIDYALVSPNIEVLKVKNIDLQFENSDHQPVTLSFKLKSLMNN